MSLALTSQSPQQTAALAARLGAVLRAGDTVLLDGEIGAGKTHFARHLVQSRQSPPEDVPSPTYTLVQTYETDGAAIWHADLYRLSALEEIEELGLAEAFESAICLVEWPERMGDLAPRAALTIHFATVADAPLARQLRFNWRDPAWAGRLEGFCDG